MINWFGGKNRWLSNFYSCPVTYNGITFANSEAAFQAQKAPGMASQFAKLNPSKAKALGRKVKIRKDWEEVKDQIMYEVVTAKFTQNHDLMDKLLATGDEELIEGNDWGDMYWGYDTDCKKGLNKLGQILMRVREELRTGK